MDFVPFNFIDAVCLKMTPKTLYNFEELSTESWDEAVNTTLQDGMIDIAIKISVRSSGCNLYCSDLKTTIFKARSNAIITQLQIENDIFTWPVKSRKTIKRGLTGVVQELRQIARFDPSDTLHTITFGSMDSYFSMAALNAVQKLWKIPVQNLYLGNLGSGNAKEVITWHLKNNFKLNVISYASLGKELLADITRIWKKDPWAKTLKICDVDKCIVNALQWMPEVETVWAEEGQKAKRKFVLTHPNKAVKMQFHQ
ncbi:hypothetical protein L596_010245 [Steinernema carpocapsae]|uniref:Uncharacterized protein n=1 Tax=Steinernema carpocapsae TaxID=34508 RepID=A0A4U5PI19_STECR|nr:hypothetical protein L596_010245 [Steinernema carpocapsae]